MGNLHVRCSYRPGSQRSEMLESGGGGKEGTGKAAIINWHARLLYSELTRDLHLEVSEFLVFGIDRGGLDGRSGDAD